MAQTTLLTSDKVIPLIRIETIDTLLSIASTQLNNGSSWIKYGSKHLPMKKKTSVPSRIYTRKRNSKLVQINIS